MSKNTTLEEGLLGALGGAALGGGLGYVGGAAAGGALKAAADAGKIPAITKAGRAVGAGIGATKGATAVDAGVKAAAGATAGAKKAADIIKNLPKTGRAVGAATGAAIGGVVGDRMTKKEGKQIGNIKPVHPKSKGGIGGDGGYTFTDSFNAEYNNVMEYYTAPTPKKKLKEEDEEKEGMSNAAKTAAALGISVAALLAMPPDLRTKAMEIGKKAVGVKDTVKDFDSLIDNKGNVIPKPINPSDYEGMPALPK